MSMEDINREMIEAGGRVPSDALHNAMRDLGLTNDFRRGWPVLWSGEYTGNVLRSMSHGNREAFWAAHGAEITAAQAEYREAKMRAQSAEQARMLREPRK